MILLIITSEGFSKWGTGFISVKPILRIMFGPSFENGLEKRIGTHKEGLKRIGGDDKNKKLSFSLLRVKLPAASAFQN